MCMGQKAGTAQSVTVPTQAVARLGRMLLTDQAALITRTKLLLRAARLQSMAMTLIMIARCVIF